MAMTNHQQAESPLLPLLTPLEILWPARVTGSQKNEAVEACPSPLTCGEPLEVPEAQGGKPWAVLDELYLKFVVDSHYTKTWSSI